MTVHRRDPIRFFRGARAGFPREARVTVHFESGTVALLAMTIAGKRKSPGGFEWGYSGSGPTALAMALCARATGSECPASTVIAVRDSLLSSIESDEWEIPLTRVLDTISVAAIRRSIARSRERRPTR